MLKFYKESEFKGKLESLFKKGMQSFRGENRFNRKALPSAHWQLLLHPDILQPPGEIKKERKLKRILETTTQVY